MAADLAYDPERLAVVPFFQIAVACFLIEELEAAPPSLELAFLRGDMLAELGDLEAPNCDFLSVGSFCLKESLDYIILRLLDLRLPDQLSQDAVFWACFANFSPV